tara:strand:+ start:720 stop:1190 length:471 start_codon:yes stop_codon:yes gene_type:complete
MKKNNLLIIFGSVVISFFIFIFANEKISNKDNSKPIKKLSGLLKIICNGTFRTPVDGLGQPFETEELIFPAEFNFDNNTGWYTGVWAISQNRKGTLKLQENILEVYRQAMFERYGFKVYGEYFSLNRNTGEFVQWLILKNQKKLYTVKGKCKEIEN